MAGGAPGKGADQTAKHEQLLITLCMAGNDTWGRAAHARMAERWHSAAANWNTVLTETLLDLATLHPGCLVLDVAAGSGEPALSIAMRLDTGGVLAIDSSYPGLLLAKRQREATGLSGKLGLAQADVHRLPLRDSCVDRITCRFGIMFFADIDTAFGEMLRVLKPGGRVAFLAWGPFAQPLFDSTVAVVLRLVPGASMPEAASTAFRFAAKGSIEDVLRRNRFRNIEERHMTLPRAWGGSPQDLWQYTQEVSTPLQPLFQAIPASLRTEVDEAVAVALARFQSGEGITVPVNVVLATAER
jgi:ubiquinone/menaquinone biosynthesis C-methylase UbiE